MTEAEVKQEVSDSGLDHLSASRIDRFVNLAARRLYNTQLWPFRLTTQSAAAPLAVTNRGTIKAVRNSEGEDIEPWDQDELDAEYNLTTGEGSAWAWYLNDAGEVAIYPPSSETITVRHYRITPSATADILSAIPETFHYIIVSDAVRRGKIENGELEAAAAYKADFDEGLAEMRRVQFNIQVQAPKQLNNV